MDSIAFTQERMKRQFDDLQDKTQVWFYAQLSLNTQSCIKRPTIWKYNFWPILNLKNYSLKRQNWQFSHFHVNQLFSADAAIKVRKNLF